MLFKFSKSIYIFILFESNRGFKNMNYDINVKTLKNSQSNDFYELLNAFILYTFINDFYKFY